MGYKNFKDFCLNVLPTIAFIVFLAWLLVGCSTTKEPGVRIEYVDRPVIKVEKCIKKEDVPKQPVKEVLPDNLESAFALALAKLSEWTGYGKRVDIIVKNCIQE